MTQLGSERATYRLTELGQAVAKSAASLQRRYLSEDRDAEILRRLARLRQSLNSAPGTTPEVWEDTLELVPETPSGSEITPRERAVCIAMGLFAFHQQGRPVPAHVEGVSLGRAASRLAASPEDEAAARRRLQAVALADTHVGVERHVRSMISLLKSADFPIGLDYGRLTDDLAALYKRGHSADVVRLGWGRDFVRQSKTGSGPGTNKLLTRHITKG